MTMTAPKDLEAHTRIIEALASRGHKDRYATLLSRCCSSAAQDLIRQVFGELVHWQRESGTRKRRMHAKRAQDYHEALERLVGDLLRACAATNATGRIFHS